MKEYLDSLYGCGRIEIRERNSYGITNTVESKNRTYILFCYLLLMQHCHRYRLKQLCEVSLFIAQFLLIAIREFRELERKCFHERDLSFLLSFGVKRMQRFRKLGIYRDLLRYEECGDAGNKVPERFRLMMRMGN